MTEDELYIRNAQDEADRYIHHIDEALAASDPEEMRANIMDAQAVGQTLMDTLDDTLSTTDDMEYADQLEEAMHHLGMALDQGDQALEMNDEDLEDGIMEIRRHAVQSVALVGQTI